mgnify:FL=1
MTTNDTQTTFPPHLIEGFKKLADDFEAHIRADERSRIAAKFRDAFPDKPVAKPGLFPITDLHGEPLQETAPQPVRFYNADNLNDTHRAMISWLSRGIFMAVPTLAGHIGVKKTTVYNYLTDLKNAGHDLEVRTTGNLKGGYRNIYRLANTG